MKTTTRTSMAVILILVVVLGLMVALVFALFRSEEPDPHEGQVYINDGFGMVWMTPLEGVPVSDIKPEEIIMQGSKPVYTGTAYTTLRGIDVSEHQWGIDWEKVGKSDVDFAYIRLGYRGYTEGGIFEDPYFKDNMKGALSNGLQAGVYFFSQAISVEEAVEEANYVLERIKTYNITLPVVFDWEKLDDVPARTYGLGSDVLTDCALAFCQTIEAAGYDASFAQAMGTTDDALRTDAFRNCEKLLAEDAANIYIQDLPEFVALNKKYSGYRFYPIYVLDVTTIQPAAQ